MKTVEDIKKTLEKEKNSTQAPKKELDPKEKNSIQAPKKELDPKLKEKLDNILKNQAQSTASNSLENLSENSEK